MISFPKTESPSSESSVSDRSVAARRLRPFRVLHVIPSISRLRGGPSQAVLELVRATNRSVCVAEIACTNDDGPQTLSVPLGCRTEYEGAPIWFFPRWSPRVRSLREFAFSLPLTHWLSKHMAGYDLVHVHALFSYAPSLAMRIARRQKIPYIVRPSGLLCRWSLEQSAWRKRLFLSCLDRANLNGSAVIEFTAEQEREEAMDLGLKAPGCVIPYGLHLPNLHPDAQRQLRAEFNLPPDEPVVLFLSRLHPKKGVDVLIRAAHRLHPSRFTVLIAGSGSNEYEASLKALARSGPASDRIRFIGFATGRLKELLLQGATVFALPSQSESFAIAALEALAVGTPVVTTPGVPLALLIRKFRLGWVCTPEEESLRSCLHDALCAAASGAVSNERIQRSRRIVERHFTWDRIASRMQELYSAVLENRSLPSLELGSIRD